MLLFFFVVNRQSVKCIIIKEPFVHWHQWVLWMTKSVIVNYVSFIFVQNIDISLRKNNSFLPLIWIKKLNILFCIEIYLKALLLQLKEVKRILMSFLTSFGSSTGKLLWRNWCWYGGHEVKVEDNANVKGQVTQKQIHKEYVWLCMWKHFYNVSPATPICFTAMAV